MKSQKKSSACSFLSVEKETSYALLLSTLKEAIQQLRRQREGEGGQQKVHDCPPKWGGGHTVLKFQDCVCVGEGGGELLECPQHLKKNPAILYHIEDLRPCCTLSLIHDLEISLVPI